MARFARLKFPAVMPLVAMLTALCFFGGCASARPVLELQNTVIDGEARWSGTVLVSGVVTVKKGGSLTILPGTRVLFERIDLDGDGIGDSELLVEGRISVLGTAEQPVLFTSAEEQPRPADWKYLYLDFAKPSQIEHLVSEYAYSGIQVHFCRARIVDSVFRHNVDGVRFSTVRLELAGNRIHGNRHGLRYEERRSEANIHHNDIRDNDIGVFVVTRSEDRARIEQNNIAGNRQYNVKIGLAQQGDVTFPGNWWGTSDEEKIAGGFFDRQYDETLGRVRAPSPLPGPVNIEQHAE